MGDVDKGLGNRTARAAHVVGIITQVRVKPRRDRGGLEPKSKRRRRKKENRLRTTVDHTGTRPYNTENAYGRRHRKAQTSEYVLKSTSK